MANSPTLNPVSTSTPEKNNEQVELWVKIGFFIALGFLFPLGAFIYGVWLLLFTYARLPWWIPSPFAGVFSLLSLAMGSLSVNSFSNYFTEWSGFLSKFFGKTNIGFWDILHFTFNQLLLMMWLSTVGAACTCALRWFNRPKYKERNIVPGPILKRRAKKNIEEIEGGFNAPQSGIILGIAKDLRDGRFAGGFPGEKYGNKTIITEAESSGHILICGASGAGKTSAMMIGLRDAIRQGQSVIFIDCKGGPDIPRQLENWAERYNREFLHWSIHDKNTSYTGPADAPAYYDPISRGSSTRRKDLLVNSQKWDVEYYKTVIENYLQTLFSVSELVPAKSGIGSFSDVAELLTVSALQNRARNIPRDKYPELSEAIDRLSAMGNQETSAINNMYQRMNTLTASTAGTWLRSDPKGERDINFRKAAEEGQVIVFSLDTSNYEAISTQIAGLIIQDLKTLTSELRNDPSRNLIRVYVDEFSSIESTNILGLISKARDARMPVMLSTLSLADLAKKDPQFVDQVIGIVSAFILLRVNSEKDARIYAGLSGVTKKIKEKGVVEGIGNTNTGFSGNSGIVGQMEEREDHMIHAGVFQALEMGQAIYIAKAPTARYVNYVQIVREKENLAHFKSDQGVELHDSYRSYDDVESRDTYQHPDSAPLDKIEEDAENDEPTYSDIYAKPKRPSIGVAIPTDPLVSGLPAGTPIPMFGSQNRPAGEPIERIEEPAVVERVEIPPDDWMMP